MWDYVIGEERGYYMIFPEFMKWAFRPIFTNYLVNIILIITQEGLIAQCHLYVTQYI